jgi:membrane protein YdbS with pleckstrin-like domain
MSILRRHREDGGGGDFVRSPSLLARGVIMAIPHDEFPIQREEAARYFYWGQILLIVLAGIWFFGLGLLVAAIHAFTLGPWLSQEQGRVLRYWLEGSTLRVDQGVFFLKRKAIPLDRVTDIILVQGPLMRWCGIWGVNIQTAGAGQAISEATLYGLVNAEEVRDLLLEARDRAAALAR